MNRKKVEYKKQFVKVSFSMGHCRMSDNFFSGFTSASQTEATSLFICDTCSHMQEPLGLLQISEWACVPNSKLECPCAQDCHHAMCTINVFCFITGKNFKVLEQKPKRLPQIPKDRFYLIMNGGKIGRPLFPLKVCNKSVQTNDFTNTSINLTRSILIMLRFPTVWILPWLYE